MSTYPNPPGPAPKRDSQRRRYNKPASYGAAVPTTALAAPRVERVLGIADPHPMVQDLWDAVQHSAEARFYSDADWQRLRAELWYGNNLMASGRMPSGHSWSAFQSGLNELLLSPAVKRRAGIEVKPLTDADAVAADEIVAGYKRVLKSV